jgi:hypothetical protein
MKGEFECTSESKTETDSFSSDVHLHTSNDEKYDAILTRQRRMTSMSN